MKKMLCLLLLLAGFANAAAYVISNGDYDHGTIDLDNYDSLLVTGGGAYRVSANDYSSIVVQDTAPLQVDVGGIASIYLNDRCTLEISGGEVGSLHFYSYAIATLSGGSINKIFSFQSAYLDGSIWNPHIVIDCREHYLDGNLLTGVWDIDNDGDGEYDTFSIELKNQAGYSPVIDNIRFIPEPCSFVLLGLGGLIIRRK